MKSTLEFVLPQESIEFHQASHAAEAWSLIYELDSMLRNHLKYGSDSEDPQFPFDSVSNLCEYIRKEIADVLHKVES